MEKNIYLQCEKEHSEQTLQQRLNGIRALLSKPICLFASYYSAVLGREISMRQTLLLLNAQLAFVFTVMPVDAHLIGRAAGAGSRPIGRRNPPADRCRGGLFRTC